MSLLNFGIISIDISSFLVELSSVRADVDAILSILVVYPHAAPNALLDDMVLDALFSGDAEEKREHALM